MDIYLIVEFLLQFCRKKKNNFINYILLIWSSIYLTPSTILIMYQLPSTLISIFLLWPTNTPSCPLLNIPCLYPPTSSPIHPLRRTPFIYSVFLYSDLLLFSFECAQCHLLQYDHPHVLSYHLSLYSLPLLLSNKPTPSSSFQIHPPLSTARSRIYFFLYYLSYISYLSHSTLCLSYIAFLPTSLTTLSHSPLLALQLNPPLPHSFL